MHPQTLTTSLSGEMCAHGAERPSLFPPRDADADAYRAWLARAAWPEVVFGARIPAASSPS